ncbi:SDR family NAD(P)-dependent oxidoreductase [Entomohabitans teleogrylli]|uniref:SDR family NAD(P)-dependent oxidoreductase n=1 Tax=Entomohabitans teleogrylli TaxID=1384589 RepID=UPI00073D266A|nr:SDR family NAD(P)-dependent oxidoreductase [Entomohabitans teleogrylli]
MTQKWILITGGSRGIGQALVTRLLRDWNVVFTGRSAAAIEQTLAMVQEMADDRWVEGYACDGKDEKQVEDLSRALLDRLGAPHAIIHNAGIARDALHIHQDAEVWREVLDNNLVSVINWNRMLLPSMLVQREGAIVLMSSVSALKGNSGQTAYAASKAAMVGLTRSLALEVGRFGIRVNCLAPGLINSDMTQAIPEAKLKALRQAIPLRRLGEPEEVARMASFLIGEESQYLTGQTLVLDGGLSA